MKLFSGKVLFVSLIASAVCFCSSGYAMNINSIEIKPLDELENILYKTITADQIDRAIQSAGKEDKEFLSCVTSAHGNWKQFRQHPEWLGQIIKAFADDEVIMLNIVENACKLKKCQQDAIREQIFSDADKVIDRAIQQQNQKFLSNIISDDNSWQQFKWHPDALESIIKFFADDEMIILNIFDNALQQLGRDQGSKIIEQIAPCMNKIINRAIQEKDQKLLLRIIVTRGSWAQFRQSPDLLERILMDFANDEVIVCAIIEHCRLTKNQQKLINKVLDCVKVFEDNGNDKPLHSCCENFFRHDRDFMIRLLHQHQNEITDRPSLNAMLYSMLVHIIYEPYVDKDIVVVLPMIRKLLATLIESVCLGSYDRRMVLCLPEVIMFLQNQSKLIADEQQAMELRKIIEVVLTLPRSYLTGAELVRIAEFEHLDDNLIKKILNHASVNKDVVKAIVNNQTIPKHTDGSGWQLAYRTLHEPKLAQGKIIGRIGNKPHIDRNYVVTTSEQVSRHFIGKQLDAQRIKIEALKPDVEKKLRKFYAVTSAVKQIFDTESPYK